LADRCRGPGRCIPGIGRFTVKFKGVFSVAIAMAIGLLVLLGYFFDTGILGIVRREILNWAVILAGVAVIVGVFNLLAVHSGKVFKKEKGRIYSLVLVFSMLITFLMLVVGKGNNVYEVMLPAVQAVIIPIEASLMAILAITLTYASIRLLRTRMNFLSITFVVTALLVILGTAAVPVINYIPGAGDFRPMITQVLATGGARGILIGVALGTLTTGLRILFGSDRPYGGK
jgi:hypothetical protein